MSAVSSGGSWDSRRPPASVTTPKTTRCSRLAIVRASVSSVSGMGAGTGSGAVGMVTQMQRGKLAIVPARVGGRPGRVW